MGGWVLCPLGQQVPSLSRVPQTRQQQGGPVPQTPGVQSRSLEGGPSLLSFCLKVQKGEPVGALGRTGCSLGAHPRSSLTAQHGLSQAHSARAAASLDTLHEEGPTEGTWCLRGVWRGTGKDHQRRPVETSTGGPDPEILEQAVRPE